MKLEVGMYVRTKWGIAKITDVYDGKYPEFFKDGTVRFYDGFVAYVDTCFQLIDETKCYREDIQKSSHNIIDLIEEHDILKIEEQKGVYTICEVEAFREPYTNYYFLGVRLDNTAVARKLYELNIKSIVIKEMFSSMEYKVGE